MVLGALARVGSWTLKQRIRQRVSRVTARVGELLPDIAEATDEAVNYRNMYVHGTPARIDCEELVPFLTRTLEFVFGASDLVDAGWDIESWAERGRYGRHPFGQYLREYEGSLAMLRAARASSRCGGG